MHFGKIVGGFVLDFCACLCLCYFACLLVCGVLFYFILCQYPLEKMYRLFVQREGCFPEKVILFCFVLFSALFCFLLCFVFCFVLFVLCTSCSRCLQKLFYGRREWSHLSGLGLEKTRSVGGWVSLDLFFCFLCMFIRSLYRLFFDSKLPTPFYSSLQKCPAWCPASLQVGL